MPVEKVRSTSRSNITWLMSGLLFRPSCFSGRLAHYFLIFKTLAAADTAPNMTQSPSSSSTFSPRHRWKVLTAGVAANAAFSVAFSGIPMTAVLMRTGYQLDNATLGLVLGLMG